MPTPTVTAHVYPSSGVSTGSGVAWSNPANAVSENATNATSALTKSATTSQTLRVTGFDFSSIPDGSRIMGVEVRVKRSTAGNTVNDNSVRLSLSGASIGTNLASATNYTTSLAWATYGGSDELWGTSLTDAQVRNSTFGVDFSAKLSGTTSRTVSVDAISISISYLLPGIYIEATTPEDSAAITVTVPVSFSISATTPADSASVSLTSRADITIAATTPADTAAVSLTNTPWTPANLTTPAVAWFRPGDAATSSGKVTSLASSVGSMVLAPAASGSAAPTLSADAFGPGKPGIDFVGQASNSGVPQTLRATGSFTGSTYSVFGMACIVGDSSGLSTFVKPAGNTWTLSSDARTVTVTGHGHIYSTKPVTGGAGKTYHEITCVDVPGLSIIGISSAGGNQRGLRFTAPNQLDFIYRNSAGGSHVSQASYIAGSVVEGDVIGIAYDSSNGAMWISKNGTWLWGNPNVNPGISSAADTFYPGLWSQQVGDTFSLNCGPFMAYPVPDGFAPLDTAPPAEDNQRIIALGDGSTTDHDRDGSTSLLNFSNSDGVWAARTTGQSPGRPNFLGSPFSFKSVVAPNRVGIGLYGESLSAYDPGVSTALNATTFAIGGGSWITNTQHSLSGTIGEVVLLDYEPSTEDEQRLDAYLLWSTGFQEMLPEWHPYKNEPPSAYEEPSGTFIEIAAVTPPDTASGSLSVTGTISIAATTPADTAAISLSAATDSITIAATTPADTAAGSLSVTGTIGIAATTPADSASISASVTGSISVSATTPADTAAISLSLGSSITIAAITPPDTASGSLSITGSIGIAATTPADTASISLTVTLVDPAVDYGFVRHGGSWLQPQAVFVKNSGTWIEPTSIYVKKSGVWTLVKGTP